MIIRSRDPKAIVFYEYYTRLIESFRKGEGIVEKSQAEISLNLCKAKAFKHGEDLLETYLAYDIPVKESIPSVKRLITRSELYFLNAVFLSMENSIRDTQQKVYPMLHFIGTSLIQFSRQTEECGWLIPYFHKLIRFSNENYLDNRRQYFIELVSILACNCIRFCRANYGFLNYFQQDIVIELFDWVKDSTMLTNSPQMALTHMLTQIPFTSEIVQKLINLENVTGSVFSDIYLSYRVFRVIVLRISLHSLVINPRKFKHKVEPELIEILAQSVVTAYTSEPCQGVKELFESFFNDISIYVEAQNLFPVKPQVVILFKHIRLAPALIELRIPGILAPVEIDEERVMSTLRYSHYVRRRDCPVECHVRYLGFKVKSLLRSLKRKIIIS